MQMCHFLHLNNIIQTYVREINRENSDLTVKSGIINSSYMDIIWRLSGKAAILSYAKNVKSPMNADTNYQLGTVPFDCQNYYAIITTGRNIFAFISIENNLVSMTPYSDFTSDSWMYFHVPLILK